MAEERPELDDPCYDPGPQTHIARVAQEGLPDLELQYVEEGGCAVVEGDIIVGDLEESTQRTTTEDSPTPLGIGITGVRYRWPKGIVPFEVSRSLPNPDRVYHAIGEWEAATGLRFPERTLEDAAAFPNYIRFVDSHYCRSYCGMQGGPQRVELADGCGIGETMHEIGHAIGLWHEQSRSDRDDYVRINFCNIEPINHHNFARQVVWGDDIGAYDYESIMHYGPYDYAKDPAKPTITSKIAGKTFGQRTYISAGDRRAVEALYSRVGGPFKTLLLPSSWVGDQTSWLGGFEYRNVFGFGYAFGAGSGAFTYRFGLSDYAMEGREAAVSAVLSSGVAGQESDVTLFVNSSPYSTYRVQAHQPGAGGSRYQWVFPEQAFRPGQVNTVELRVDGSAEMRNGLSVFQTQGSEQAYIEVAIPHERDSTLLEYDAGFVSQSVPAFMAPGSRHTAVVTMRNVGTAVWRPGRIRLGSQEPENNPRWCTVRADLPAGIDVAPGTNGAFTFPVVAPTSQGSHSFRWKVLREGVGWFGQSNRPLSITVAADSLPVRQNIPPAIVSGTTATASVTLRNIGQVAWTRGSYRLASQNPANNAIWRTSRVELPHDVAPGAEVTFSFPVTAPETVGQHNMQWQLYADGRGWLGLPTGNVVVRVMPPLTTQSVFVSQVVPSPMPPGSLQKVTVRMRNVGTATWTAAEGYRLGSQNPMDNTRWGLHRVPLPHDVPPNGEVAFTFTVKTHPFETFMNSQWQMLQEGVGWFGQMSPNVEVRVAYPLRGAIFVRQSVPTSMTIGSPPNASITMRNTGEETWRPGGNYRLGSQNPMDNRTWGTNRISVPHDVPPNTEVTFVFPMAATTTGAEKNFQWKMVLDGVAWFGQPTPNMLVRVR